MPACSSSPIDQLAAGIGSSRRVIDTDTPWDADAGEPADLVAALTKVPDPRSAAEFGIDW